MNITAHMLIKNEENWVWFAIQAVLPHVTKLIIFDTGSTDKTIAIIEHIVQSDQHNKISLFKKNATNRSDLVSLRQEMVTLTQTKWFVLVDGDEVWSKKSFTKLLKKLGRVDDQVIGAVVRTRNCVGDLFHYQPDTAGEYTLKGRKGHLTIRAYRKFPAYQWRGEYPLEGYIDSSGVLLNDQDDKLIFIDTYYYHLTHLKRSTDADSARVIDRIKKYKLEIGQKTQKADLPEVFFLERPDFVPDPFVRFSAVELVLAYLLTPLRLIKRRLQL